MKQPQPLWAQCSDNSLGKAAHWLDYNWWDHLQLHGRKPESTRKPRERSLPKEMLYYGCTALSCSVVSDSADLWMAACQAPQSMGFSRQEHWSGLWCHPPEDSPDPQTDLELLTSLALANRFFTTTGTDGDQAGNQTLSLGVLSARHQEGSKTTRKRTGVSKQGKRKQRGADEQRGQSGQKEEQRTSLWGPGCPTSPRFPAPTTALPREEVGPSNNWMDEWSSTASHSSRDQDCCWDWFLGFLPFLTCSYHNLPEMTRVVFILNNLTEPKRNSLYPNLILWKEHGGQRAWHFFTENIKMANKQHLKRCSMSLEKCKIQTVMRYCFTPIRAAILKGEVCNEIGNLIHGWWNLK